MKLFIHALLARVSVTLVQAEQPARIDRKALVTRHNPAFTRIDPSAPMMVGNGNIAFTADITGLQTFQEQYSPLVPLMTQAQWAWHSFPNPDGFTLKDALAPVEVRGRTRRYPWLANWDEARKPHIQWLRENPHRYSLARLGLFLARADGAPAAFADVSNTVQHLDMWTARLHSQFVFDGARVDVETSVHPYLDIIIVKLRSPLLGQGRLGIDLKFPGVNAKLNPDPADWTIPDSHQTREIRRGKRGIALERRLDATRYFVDAYADQPMEIKLTGPHGYRFTAKDGDSLTLLVSFSPKDGPRELPSADAARSKVTSVWHDYWTIGGAIDFSGSTDPRAAELERRVVLSQYLMVINGAGEMPPQEEGLFSNSWNGKSHLEMHLWHSAHFATWGKPELLEISMPWYQRHLPAARQRARDYGVRGAWWPKMVGPEGRESPSTINPFIMWQQPHPIYLAELIYRARPDPATLRRYQEVVFATADLLASYPYHDKERDRYVIGPPIVPAQEVFPPLTTFNPTFELEYFRFGLATAQHWRERSGLKRQPDWDRVLQKLSPLPTRDGVYLATESTPQLWEQARSAACAPGKTARECLNRDHPSFLAAYGLLPGDSVDRETMRRTLDAVLAHWDLRQTWGWDFPVLAMTAARLGQPQRAVDFLLWDARNFRFGPTGMTPRVHLDEHAAELIQGASPDGAGYRRAAETYFPSNGSLLLAVGMMAAGWDGATGAHPGFPTEGWVVRSEGLRPLP